MVYAPFVCRKCSKKRAERKEIITEIVETEQKYGRDLQIILEEFHRPMLRAGLLTSEQLSAIFLNVEELLEHNLVLAEKLKDSVELAQVKNSRNMYFGSFCRERVYSKVYYCLITFNRIGIRGRGPLDGGRRQDLPRVGKNAPRFRELLHASRRCQFVTTKFGEREGASSHLPQGFSNGEHGFAKDEPELLLNGNVI